MEDSCEPVLALACGGARTSGQRLLGVVVWWHRRREVRLGWGQGGVGFNRFGFCEVVRWEVNHGKNAARITNLEELVQETQPCLASVSESF